jgi:hypothetical protein
MFDFGKGASPAMANKSSLQNAIPEYGAKSEKERVAVIHRNDELATWAEHPGTL